MKEEEKEDGRMRRRKVGVDGGEGTEVFIITVGNFNSS
jgi:hypothetical protein